MITVNSDIPYLGIPYAYLLDVDIIQNLREGFGMMGMRFTGKTTKAEIVKGYDEYVKENPADVLRCLTPESLSQVSRIIKQGRGGHIMLQGTQLYNQLQKMNLVVTREDTNANTSDIYLIDELYDLFAPHIDYVLQHPVDYSVEDDLKTPLDAVIFEITYKCRELIAFIEDWTKKQRPRDMSKARREKFSEALDQYEETLDEYAGKLTSLSDQTPGGFGIRLSDMDRIQHTISQVRDVIVHMQTLLDAVNSKETIDVKDDDYKDVGPEEKAQLDQVLQSKELKDVIDRITKDRMDAMKEAQRAEREDGPVKFLPAFTKHPAKYPPMKESYCATRLVRPRVFEVTIPLEDGLYFIVYFNFLEQNGYTQATCYWGNIFDFAQKAASEPYPGAGYVMLSKPFRKKYPHVAAVYGMHDDLSISDRLLPAGRKNQDCTKPYLTTIGWEHQAKEWFLSVRLYNFDYVKLITYSPLDCPEVIEAIDALKEASLAMMHDIQRSDAKQPKLLMKELFAFD